ncbi:histone-lysine N-methyltransferase SETMAR-like isoform X1, partial [Lates japonicus]
MTTCPLAVQLKTQVFLAATTQSLLPPYLLDSPPCNFILFPRMKFKLMSFDTVDEIQHESQMVLDVLTEQDFQGTVQEWQECRERCIAAHGNYFEENGSQI